MLNMRLKDSGIKMSDAAGHSSFFEDMGTRHVAVRRGSIVSSELFADTREIIIQHGDMVYRLRLTAQDKLILTK